MLQNEHFDCLWKSCNHVCILRSSPFHGVAFAYKSERRQHLHCFTSEKTANVTRMMLQLENCLVSDRRKYATALSCIGACARNNPQYSPVYLFTNVSPACHSTWVISIILLQTTFNICIVLPCLQIVPLTYRSYNRDQVEFEFHLQPIHSFTKYPFVRVSISFTINWIE